MIAVLAYLDEGSGGGGGGIGPVELVIILVLLGVWIGPVYLIARWAERKGQPFGLFIVLGLVIGPVLIALVAALSGDKRNPKPVTVVPGPSDHLDRLQQITELRDKGTLTEEEFQAERGRIMEQR